MHACVHTCVYTHTQEHMSDVEGWGRSSSTGGITGADSDVDGVVLFHTLGNTAKTRILIKCTICIFHYTLGLCSLLNRKVNVKFKL